MIRQTISDGIYLNSCQLLASILLYSAIYFVLSFHCSWQCILYHMIFFCVQILLLKIPRGWDLLLCWKTSDTSLDTLISSWLAAQESSWFATSSGFSFSKLASNCIERINRNGVSGCFISNRLKTDCSKLRKYGNISSSPYNNTKFYPYSCECTNSST